MGSEFTHQMRAEELLIARRLLPQGGKILDFGSGDGWQARELANAGFDITAVDIDPDRIGGDPRFPVRVYDGYALPFPDASFDAIYSSNVMEHVEAFQQIQGELARVLKPGGMALHCVPTGVWRFWTSATHPIYAVKMLARLARQGQSRQVRLEKQLSSAHGMLGRAGRLLRMGLLSPRHGEHGTWLCEHWLFTRRCWKRRFERSGWRVHSTVPVGVAYTGNENFGTHLGTGARRWLAKILGSSAIFFLLTPGDTQEHGT